MSHKSPVSGPGDGAEAMHNRSTGIRQIKQPVTTDGDRAMSDKKDTTTLFGVDVKLKPMNYRLDLPAYINDGTIDKMLEAFNVPTLTTEQTRIIKLFEMVTNLAQGSGSLDESEFGVFVSLLNQVDPEWIRSASGDEIREKGLIKLSQVNTEIISRDFETSMDVVYDIISTLLRKKLINP